MPSRTNDFAVDEQNIKLTNGTPKPRPAKTPSSPIKREERPKAQDVAELKDYQLGDCLGKGAFGAVYRALNWNTGETVAVKQIKLADLPKSELRVIMLEIDLLKNLDHPNIVKYHGFVKTPETLNIILEYCENGSLHTIAKNFGRFPENLVALYMSQVLQGLLYLHEQGVIHRDIKGANILTTKQGLVKLADFGVASRTTGLHESSVVGTPYWMAPEVIELTGATTSSDIWSLGCTVIELLDGKPPYHNLQPMQALFRIVNDDHPPLPQSASPLVVDFLGQCFLKDPNFRVSAKKLLKHPWIVNARRNDARDTKSATNYDEAVKEVQQWNEALKDSPTGAGARKNSRTATASPIPTGKEVSRPTSTSSRFTLTAPTLNDSTERFRSPEGEESDNWDDDFATAISPDALRLPHLRPLDHFRGIFSTAKVKPYASMDNSVDQNQVRRDDDKDKTLKSPVQPTESYTPRTVLAVADKKHEVRHTRHRSEIPPKVKAKTVPTPRKTSLPTNKPASGQTKQQFPTSKPPIDLKQPQLHRESSFEDYSDIIAGNEEEFDSKVGMFWLSNEGPPKILDSPSVTDLMQSMKPPQPSGSLRRPPAVRSRMSMRRTRSSIEIQRFAENEADEDFSDLPIPNTSFLEKSASEEGSEPSTIMLNSKISNPSRLSDGDEEEDVFAQLEESLPQTDKEDNLARVWQVRPRIVVEELVDQLKVLEAGRDDETLLHISEELMNRFDHYEDTKHVIVSTHGVLPILEILDGGPDPAVVLNLLKIINAIIYNDESVQEKLCFVGGIPKINKFASKKFGREIRLQAAAFVRQMYQTSPLTRQLFVSAGGLSVLVEFLEDDYDDDRELVLIGVNGIWSVLELQGSTPKNDFCRILSGTVLDPLSLVLTRVLNEPSESGEHRELAELCEGRIASIFFIFSQAENYVKQLIAERTVLHRVLKNLKKMSRPHQTTMLKFIRNLSRLPTTLDALHISNAIDVLTELLADGMGKVYFRELSNQILSIMNNLCRLNRRRQEDAAVNGIVPILIKIVKQDMPSKQFAVPILCDMADAGRAARRELWQHKGLAFYISLLTDPYWQDRAVDAIFRWLQEETSKVEDYLRESQDFAGAIVVAFTSTESSSFEKLLETVMHLLRLSRPVASSLSDSPEFFKSIRQKLTNNKAAIKVNLLRILQSICSAVDDGAELLDRHGLWELVLKLEESDPGILVQSMATELIATCDISDNISLQSSHSGNLGVNGARRKHPAIMRRTSSGTASPFVLERQLSMPTSPQLGRSERASMSFFDAPERITQTPRRPRNGVGYMNGSAVMRPASREGATYFRENSPAFVTPSVSRTGVPPGTASEMSVNKSRLPRQAPGHRLSRQPTRPESVISNGSHAGENGTPIVSTPVTDTRRKENVYTTRQNASEVTVAGSTSASARKLVGRRQQPPEGKWT